MTVEELVPDGLWAEIAPLLPPPPARPEGRLFSIEVGKELHEHIDSEGFS
jgi:hypothetical protein